MSHAHTHTVRSGLAFSFFFSPVRGKRITSARPQNLASPMLGEGESVAAASADKSYRSHKPFAQQGG